MQTLQRNINFNFYKDKKMELNNIIEPIEVKSRVYLNKMSTITLVNEADKDCACALLKEVTEYKKSIEAQRKELTAPLKSEVKDIEAKFKDPLNFLDEADKLLRAKINHYLNEQRARLEAEALAQKQKQEEEALQQALELEKIKKEAGDYDEVTRQALIQFVDNKQDQIINDTAKQAKINQSTSTSTVRQVWTFKLNDLSQVPVEYLQLNESAVRQAIKNGVRNIAGLDIYQTSQIAIK